LANILFTIAWCVVVFALVRALVLLWVRDARTAGLTAISVAAAFALGSWSPFVLHRAGPAAPVPAPAGVAAEPAAPPDTRSACRVGTAASGARAHGHLDTVTVNGDAAAIHDTIDVPANSPVQIAGWVLTAGNAPARAACLVVDGAVAQSTGIYGLDRPDVAAAMRTSAALKSGFNENIAFGPGTHRLTLAALNDAGSVIAVPDAVTVNAH
jgi:hypothetical protein